MWSLIRKDLGEFVTTIKDEATVTLKSAMTLGEGDEGYESYYESDESQSRDEEEPRSRRQPVSAALRAMRADIKTYTEEVPESESDRYATFLGKFDIAARTKDIATLLKDDPVVTEIHTQLVPEHLAYDEFWTRYFFRAERVAKGEVGGGISFPRDDEEEDEDFGWGEDDQDDDADDGRDDELPSPVPPPSPAASASSDRRHDFSASSLPFSQTDPADAPAGGALGATNPPHPAGASQSTDAASAAADVGAGGAAANSVTGLRPAQDGRMKSLASAAAAAEIARLTEALRVSEAERASLTQGAAALEGGAVARGDPTDDAGRMEDLTREIDTAHAEADDLRAKLSQAEKERDGAFARIDELADELANASSTEGESTVRARQLLEASEARATAAEEESRVNAAARSAAEARLAADVGGDAEATAKEVLRLKKAFREERAEHEAMLLASREAANEAVEAALSSADADREEACAELAASMEAEGERKDVELEALRAQLVKSAVAMEEVGTLKADVAELRRSVESEREAAVRAASEARQEADAVKQLREEIRVLRAAADRPRTSAAAGRAGVGGTSKRGTNLRSDAGGEDTDGWGEDEDDSCCAASTNSSGVVVERPLSATASPRRNDENHAHRGVPSEPASGSGGGGGGDSGEAGDPGEGARALVSPGEYRAAWSSGAAKSAEFADPSEEAKDAVGRREGKGTGGGGADGEGDDGWEGWD